MLARLFGLGFMANFWEVIKS